MLDYILGFFLVAAIAVASDPSIIVYLSSIGAFIVAVATGASYFWGIMQQRKKLALDTQNQESAQATSTRSVTIEEMEAAIPGLGIMVDRWQKQAETAWAEIERLRASEEVDRAKIAELETQVRALQSELILEKKKNMRLEERISELEERKT